MDAIKTALKVGDAPVLLEKILESEIPSRKFSISSKNHLVKKLLNSWFDQVALFYYTAHTRSAPPVHFLYLSALPPLALYYQFQSASIILDQSATVLLSI